MRSKDYEEYFLIVIKKPNYRHRRQAFVRQIKESFLLLGNKTKYICKPVHFLKEERMLFMALNAIRKRIDEMNKEGEEEEKKQVFTLAQ